MSGTTSITETELRGLVDEYRILCRAQGNTIDQINLELINTQTKLAVAEARSAELHAMLHGQGQSGKVTP
jgi:hypothetical protein